MGKADKLTQMDNKKESPQEMIGQELWSQIPAAKRAMVYKILEHISQENWLQARKKIYIDYLVQGLQKEKPLPSVVDKRLAVWGKNKDFANYVKQYNTDSIEKFRIAGMVCCMSATLVIYFAKSLLTGKYLVFFSVDALVGIIAAALLIKYTEVKYSLTSSYSKSRYFMYQDLLAITLCTLLKIWLPGIFDVSLVVLIITYFLEKKRFVEAVRMLQEEILNPSAQTGRSL